MTETSNTIGPSQSPENGENKNEYVESADYVVVQDEEGGEAMELPVAPDDRHLALSTLVHAFPGAHGLKYKNPKTGASRALAVDSTGTKFLPPPDGWDDKVFTAIFSATSRGTGETKRRKVDDGDDSEEDEGAERKQKRLDGPPKPVDLIVLGINYTTTTEGFKTHFEQYGKVVAADLKMNYEGKSKGFGFVLMGSLEAQQAVLNANPHMIDGRRVEVKVPDQRSENFRNPMQSSSNELRSNKIFIGRLPETNTEELKTFFEDEAKRMNPHAVITDVFLPRPFRGFGFVTFSTCEMARKIVQANNFVMKGSPLAISLAVPREPLERPGGPSEYGSGGGGGGGYSYGYGGGVDYRKREDMGSYPSSYGYPNVSEVGSYGGGNNYSSMGGYDYSAPPRSSYELSPGYHPYSRHGKAGFPARK